MYLSYFGFKEPTFAITPDPQYLFLSEQHREALAHLVYGAGESGGFVLLTGEVGTGKTTVCRAFLEQVPDDVDVALVLNPALTVTELLGTICDELRIPIGEDERTVKCLVDRLNAHLLNAHAEGRRTVLLIDEAQNLRPKVLEQIRLLTNLETSKHKLLQIFLVGQPELNELLQRQGLRQLDQRITARYHLRPFSARDTADYIRHRLAVAGVERRLFTRPALRQVHRLTRGVPRLVNIVCDRALLGAYATRARRVTRRIVNRAAREIRGPTVTVAPAAPRRAVRPAFAWLAVAAALGSGWLVHDRLPDFEGSASLAEWLGRIDVPEPPVAKSPTKVAAVPEVAADVTDERVESAPPSVDMPPARVEDAILDQAAAMNLLLLRWGIDWEVAEQGDPCRRVDTVGLRCERETGEWGQLVFFDRPALLHFSSPDGAVGYAVLGELKAGRAGLDMPDGEPHFFELKQLDDYWTGEYVLVWQPPPVGSVLIGPGSAGESVRWLRKLLGEVPSLDLAASDSGAFDTGLRRALQQFQTMNGLEADGVAGPKTLIKLHNAVGMPVPRLVMDRS